MLSPEPDLSVCCEADSIEAALKLVRTLEADLVIVDLSLGEGTGLELIRQIHEMVPALPILILSVHDEMLFAERALRAGARGYIMKAEAIGGLVRAVRHVLSGRVYVSERLSQTVLKRLTGDKKSRSGHLGNLTDRELEVFEMVGRGLVPADIAVQLGVSVKTIETYRTNIKTKLDLKDAADLIRYAATWNQQL